MAVKLFNLFRTSSHATFYSQGREDALVAKLLNLEKPGLYIDVGAHHPIQLSNTYYLYKAGWRGICIEPNEDLIDTYRTHRPEDTIYNVAVSDFEGEADFYFGKYDVHSSLLRTENTNLSQKKVTVRKLEDILEESKTPKEIDFLSVDTEGTEVDVLEGLNLNKYRPKLILAEYNTASNANTQLQPYLVNKGYQLIFVNQWNMLFSRDFDKDVIRLYRNLNFEFRTEK